MEDNSKKINDDADKSQETDKGNNPHATNPGLKEEKHTKEQTNNADSRREDSREEKAIEKTSEERLSEAE